MRHLMLLLGMGSALLATAVCRAIPSTPLSTAAAANDADAVRRLIADGHRPDDDSPWTALMWAARRGSVEAITVLLDAGAAIDRHDGRNGWTALQHAIHTRQVDAVRVLLDRGADPNAAVHSGAITPLLMASLEPDPTVLKLLLAHGANPRVAGEGGDTPFTRAVAGGAMSDIDRPLAGRCHAATVRALLEHDPALRLPDTFNGRLALWWARVHKLGETDDPDRCADVLHMVGDTTRVGFVGATGDLVRGRDGAKSRQRRASTSFDQFDSAILVFVTAGCPTAYARHGRSRPTVMPIRGPHAIGPTSRP